MVNVRGNVLQKAAWNECPRNWLPNSDATRLPSSVKGESAQPCNCPAHESAPLRREIGEDFLLVTPGIRLDVANNQDDQRRIMTPQQALKAGSSYLVMGRPITQAADPAAVLRQINETVFDL